MVAAIVLLVAVVSSVSLLFLSFTGMGPLPFLGVRVSMTTSATVAGSMIHVAGTTDLIDGSLVTYSVWHELENPDSGHFQGRYIIDGTVAVQGGRFSYDADVSGWPQGSVQVLSRFSVETEGQPVEVAERYGASGSRLEGPNVYNDSGTRVVAVNAKVTLSP